MQVTLSIPPEFLERKILPLSLQILIENAIKHNIFSKRHPLNINIFIDEEQFLNVINNYNKRENFIHSTGLGLENIRNRYKFFTNQELFFGQIGDNYTAKIPLL